MNIVIGKEPLQKALQRVIGGVEHRATLPILSHVLLQVEGTLLTLTATDMEIQITSYISLEDSGEDGVQTLPAKTLMDICRSLSNDARLTIKGDNEKMSITSGRGRYTLSSLPAEDFPRHDGEIIVAEFRLPASALSQLIEKTQFSMGQADVRYYLNGMLWNLSEGQFTVVSSDGHRMSQDRYSLSQEQAGCQIIVPRKSVAELARILSDVDEDVLISIGENSLTVCCSIFEFISKQIDGSYPQYTKFIPLNNNRFFVAPTQKLKELLSRIAVFTHDKQRTILFEMSENNLLVKSSSMENNVGEEDLEIQYQGERLSLGFNVSYLVECLSAISTEQVKFSFSSSGSGVILEPEGVEDAQNLYVIMPICL